MEASHKVFFVTAFFSIFTMISVVFIFPKSEAITQIANPSPANAELGNLARNAIVSISQGIFEGNAYESTIYGSNLFITIPADSFTRFLCGESVGVNEVFAKKRDCMLPELNSNLTRPTGFFQGGFAGLATLTATSMATEPPIPTDMALYLNDTFGDTIFGTPAFAQSYSKPNSFFRQTTFVLWKMSRDVALAAVGLLLAVAAIGVIFRQKINPQVTVTVSSILPYVPISLAGIILSYPLVTIAYNAVIPLMGVAWNLGWAFIGEVASDAVSNVTSASLWGIVSTVFRTIINILVGPAIGLPLVIMALILMVTVVFMIFKYIIEAIKTILNFVVIVIAFPLVSVLAILPARQKLILVLFKKILANVLALPIMTLMLLAGLGIIFTMASINVDPLASLDDVVYVFSFGGIIAAIIKFSIGIGVMWQGFKARKILENVLGAGESLSNLAQGVQEKR